MKKILLLLPLLLILLTVVAKPLLEQQAEQLYQEGKYKEAAELYHQILSEGVESADLYYNLGNCHFKMKENTVAILNYEKALLLNPSDEMARYNLEMAQHSVVDKIEVLPELFLVRWYKAVETHFSADQWGYISIILFIIFLVMAALFFYSRFVGVKKIGFITGIIVLLLTVCSIFFAMRQNERIINREYAIIITPSVTVKGAPDNSGTSLFLIHEGLKVKVIGELGSWYNIRLKDGNEGWVAKSDLEKI
ncbi:MAG: tetratricopeptide repeat protein [Odoribacter sp.]